jgi:hypothetical protein
LRFSIWGFSGFSPDALREVLRQKPYYAVELKYDENGVPVQRSGGGRGRERGLCERFFEGLKDLAWW